MTHLEVMAAKKYHTKYQEDFGAAEKVSQRPLWSPSVTSDLEVEESDELLLPKSFRKSILEILELLKKYPKKYPRDLSGADR